MGASLTIRKWGLRCLRLWVLSTLLPLSVGVLRQDIYIYISLSLSFFYWMIPTTLRKVGSCFECIPSRPVLLPCSFFFRDHPIEIIQLRSSTWDHPLEIIHLSLSNLRSSSWDHSIEIIRLRSSACDHLREIIQFEIIQLWSCNWDHPFEVVRLWSSIW